MTGLDELLDSIEQSRLASARKTEREAAELGITPDELMERREAEWREREHRERCEAIAKSREGCLVASGVRLSEQDIRTIAAGKASDTKAIRAITRFMDQEKFRILFLCGPVGTGKTFAAAHSIADNGGGIFVRSRHLPVVMNPIGDMRERIERASLVLLDDLGLEDPNDPKWGNAWFEFVDSRQCNGKTIITTNLDQAKMRARYDERVLSRLAACAFAMKVEAVVRPRNSEGWL